MFRLAILGSESCKQSTSASTQNGFHCPRRGRHGSSIRDASNRPPLALAAHADEAIAILEARQDIHLVFTDIDMPGSMDGLKLAAAVRDRWPPVHIIITTGKTRPLEIPANALFIPKPYLGRTVVSAMRTFENMG